MDEPTLFPPLAQIQPSLPAGGLRPGTSFVPLAAGEVLDAIVVAKDSAGSVLIDVRGGLVRAGTEIEDLRLRESLTVRVEQDNGKTVLRVLQRTPTQTATALQAQTAAVPVPQVAESPLVTLLKVLLPSSDSVPRDLQQLIASVSRAAEDGTMSPDEAGQFTRLLERIAFSLEHATGPNLRNAILALGLRHEQAILEASDHATLKGWLIQALARHPDAPWAKEAEAVLSGIERTQVLNALNVETGQPVILELPFCFGGALSVRVYVEEDGRGQRTADPERRTFRMTTLVELTGLGAVRVDATLAARTLMAGVVVADARMEAVASAGLPLLRQRLTDLGFTVERLSCVAGDPGMRRGEELQQRTMPRVDLVDHHA